MEGQGEMIWPTGDKYIGDWEGDTRHGFGLYLYQSGNRYKGQYVAGKKVRIICCPVSMMIVLGWLRSVLVDQGTQCWRQVYRLLQLR